MATTQGKANTNYQISQEDLKDPTLYRLNSDFTSVNSRITTMAGNLTALANKVAAIAGAGNGSSFASIVTTHANRNNFNPANYSTGSLLTETDRNSVYQVRLVSNQPAWVFLEGRMEAPFVSLPTDLGTPDTGFIFYDNTNSLHTWEWIGTAWTWGPGNDLQSGAMVEYDFNPGAGWHICDGTPGLTKYTKTAGTTTFTVPDRRGFYPENIALASYTGVGVAAVAPGVTTTTVLTAGAVNVVETVDATGRPPTFGVPVYYRL